MFDKTRDWARSLLREWYEEQLKGGPVRVIKGKGRGKHATKGALYTTLQVVQRELPPARDLYINKKIKEHDRDLDTMSERINTLTSEVRYLQQLMNRR